MRKPHILVVDDEPDLVELVEYNLKREHFQVTTTADGESALELARKELPDLILLDLMLPGIDGLEVCRQLKSEGRTSHIPIIMLTAKADEADAVIGLAQGADDYVRKPFGIRELVARVSARIRASESALDQEDRQVIKHGDLVLDSIKHEVELDGQPVQLTMTEFKLLRHLMSNVGRALSRNQLLDGAIAPDTVVIDRNVDVHIATLRKKLGKHASNIETIRGLGYKLKSTPVPTE